MNMQVWDSINRINKGCIDKQCSGFVQTTIDKPYLGDVRSPSTPIGERGKKSVVIVKIQRVIFFKEYIFTNFNTSYINFYYICLVDIIF
jgi:hypothetical protein